MLKTARFDKDEQFIQKLAKATQPKPLRVTSQEMELPDDAIQAAQAYWLQGWSWEEIEATLIDSEYTDAEVKKAMKAVQDYAEKINQEGPFANTLAAGQQVRLTSGTIAQLVNYSPKNILVDDGQDQYIVTPDKIDVEATKRLRDASKLRNAADKLVAAPKPKYKLTDAPEESISTSPDPAVKPKYDFEMQTKAPAHWRESEPPLSEIPQANNVLTSMVDQLDGLQQQMDALKSETAEIKKVMIQPLEQKRKELMVQHSEVTQAVFAAVDEELESQTEVYRYVFRVYKSKILALRRNATQNQYVPDAEKTLNFVMDYLKGQHAKIVGELEEAIAKFEKANMQIEEVQENVGRVYNVKGTKQAQMFGKVKEWLKGIWKTIQSGVGLIYSHVLPHTEEAVEKIDEQLALSETASVRITYDNAIKSMRQARQASYLPRPKIWQG